MPNYVTGQARALAPGDSVYLFGVPNTAAALATSPTGAVRTNGIVTITTGSAHNFIPGQQVDLRGVGSVGGFLGVYGFDGSYTILTVPTTTTFTFADPGKPNDTGGGGNAFSVAAEQPAVPQAGAAAHISASQLGQDPVGLGIEGWWTGAPGAFEVDLQTADTDIDSAYIMNTVSTATKVTANASDTNATGNNFRVDLIPFGGRFFRPRIITRTNGVGLVLKLTRVA